MGQPARYNRWLGRVSGNFVGPSPARVEHIHECNFSARTSALRAIGGFNEEFQGNAYFEGADLALRLIDAVPLSRRSRRRKSKHWRRP